MTLLDLAQATRRKERTPEFDREVMELAVAWLEGRIGYAQAAHALGASGSNVYNYLCQGMRRAYKQGALVQPGGVTEGRAAAKKAAR